LPFFVGWVEGYLSQQDMGFAPSTQPLFVGWVEQYLSQPDIRFAPSTQPRNLLVEKPGLYTKDSISLTNRVFGQPFNRGVILILLSGIDKGL
jgi:hypothetical protein